MSVALVRFTGGWLEQVGATVADLRTSDRFEAFISLGALQSDREARRVAAGQLLAFQQIQRMTEVGTLPLTDDITPYLGYAPGDSILVPIYAPGGSEVTTPRKVAAITVSMDDETGIATVTPAFVPPGSSPGQQLLLDPDVAVLQAVKKMINGTLRGQSRVAQPWSQGLGLPQSAPAELAEVDSAENFTPGGSTVLYEIPDDPAIVAIECVVGGIGGESTFDGGFNAGRGYGMRVRFEVGPSKYLQTGMTLRLETPLDQDGAGLGGGPRGGGNDFGPLPGASAVFIDGIDTLLCCGGGAGHAALVRDAADTDVILDVHQGGDAGYPNGSAGHGPNAGAGGTQSGGGAAGGSGGGAGSFFQGGEADIFFPFTPSGAGGGGYYGGGSGGAAVNTGTELVGYAGGGGTAYRNPAGVIISQGPSPANGTVGAQVFAMGS